MNVFQKVLAGRGFTDKQKNTRKTGTDHNTLIARRSTTLTLSDTTGDPVLL